MLFDLFACFDLGTTKLKVDNPFKDLEAYKKMMFAEQETSSDNAYLLSLHKRHDDNVPVHEDSNYDVRIFGYCFPRIDNSQLKDRIKLSANRIALIYEDIGPDFVKNIKGSFSILIYDKRKREVLVFSDPLNIRPFYYYQKDNRLAVSTSLSALSKFIQDQKEEVLLNYPAIIEYNIFGYILNEDTYIQQVKMMSPGSILKYSAQETVINQYWNIFENLRDFKIEFKEDQRALDMLEKLLKKNLGLYLFDSDRTAMALSGDLNTRTNVALLGNKSKDYLFYSYGTENNYDFSISKKIAKSANLRFKPIYYDETFQKSFNKNTEIALGLGDGMAEGNHLNSLYAYKEIGKSYDYILTGLFGTELLSPPNIPSDFVSGDIQELLATDDKEKSINKILDKANECGFIEKSIIEKYREEVKDRILSNPFIFNDYKLSEKYFYFMMMVGIRKIYMKEVKIERPFVENLHPFFDIEYIELLVKTPFSWIHSWTGPGRSSNLNHDRFFVFLMDRNKPRLNNIISTKGYTPKYLLNNFFSPVLKLEHLYYVNRMKEKVNLNTESLLWEYFKLSKSLDYKADFLNNETSKEINENKDSIKLSALKHWLIKNNLVKKS